MSKRACILVVIGLLAAACGEGIEDAAPSPTTPTSVSITTTTTTTTAVPEDDYGPVGEDDPYEDGTDAGTPPPSPPESAVPDSLIAAIIDDVAGRTGLTSDSFVVVEAIAVVWNDGSLGCPEPGVFYTQATVDGYHVVVEGGGAQYDYRVGDNGAFRLCESPGAPPTTTPSG